MKPGDKVICIEQIGYIDQLGIIVPKHLIPIKDKVIYTVKSIFETCGVKCIKLVEIESRWGFKIECFKKVEPTGSLQKELALLALKDKESQKIKTIEKELVEL